MINSTVALQKFLAGTSPFNRLSSQAIEHLISKCQLLRYRLEQTIAVNQNIPANINIIYSGQARLLCCAPGDIFPETMQLLHPEETIGWVSLLCGVPCETVLATVK